MFNFTRKNKRMGAKPMKTKTLKNGNIVIKNHPLCKKVVIINDASVAAKHVKKLTVMVQPSESRLLMRKLKAYLKTVRGKIVAGSVVATGVGLTSASIILAIRNRNKMAKLVKTTKNLIVDTNIDDLLDCETFEDYLGMMLSEAVHMPGYKALPEKMKSTFINLFIEEIKKDTLSNSLDDPSGDFEDDDDYDVDVFDEDAYLDSLNSPAPPSAEEAERIETEVSEMPLPDITEDCDEAEVDVGPSVTDRVKPLSRTERFNKKWDKINPKPTDE